MRVCRKTHPPVFFGDDHAKEALVFDELPDVRWQIVEFMGNLPLISHRTQCFGGAIDESLLLCSDLGGGVVEQLVPVWLSTEKIAIPPHGAGVERLTLGLRHLREQLLVDLENRRGQQTLAN